MAHKLEVRGVGYAYHTMEGETPALSDISFTADTGEFIAVVGPSGCGKSTLLSLLCGLVKPESGAQGFRHRLFQLGRDRYPQGRETGERVVYGSCCGLG